MFAGLESQIAAKSHGTIPSHYRHWLSTELIAQVLFVAVAKGPPALADRFEDALLHMFSSPFATCPVTLGEMCHGQGKGSIVVLLTSVPISPTCKPSSCQKRWSLR